MKRYLSILLVFAIFACVLALPAHGAGESLSAAFTTAETLLPRGDAFTVDVSVTPAGAGVSALRLYVFYDKTCLDWNAGATIRHGLLASGMYALREAGSSEPAKYPAGMPAADRASYGVIVMQWCAVPSAGVLSAIPAGATVQALTLDFAVKADAPYTPGGKIFVSTDYSYADTPWFYAGDLAVDIAAAQLTIFPLPPAPVFSTTLAEPGNGYIYGFPADIPRIGGVLPWSDGMINTYCSATNEGVLSLVPPVGCHLTGTGTQLQLWNANKTLKYGDYTLIVFGDIDGNFVIDFDDWAALKIMPTGPVGTDDPFRFAADVNRDGTIDAADLGLLLLAAKGETVIAQG